MPMGEVFWASEGREGRRGIVSQSEYAGARSRGVSEEGRGERLRRRQEEGKRGGEIRDWRRKRKSGSVGGRAWELGK